MPSCMMNLINGGVHAGWSTDIQEYMIVPKIKSARGQVRCGAEVFHSLEKNISGENLNTTVGDEGGFSLRLNSNEKPLQFLLKAIKSAGYMPGREVGFALDVAASEFYKKGLYSLKAEKKQGNSQIIFHIFERWLKKYPIVSIEDGLDQDDWKGWQELTLKFGKNVDLVGDDLFVTNKERLQTGIHSGVANAILIKLNQIGSLSETADTVTLAQQNGYKIAVSHRSGETNDDFISDLAVACGADYLKAGSLSRGERVAKYNRLIEIESELLSL